MKNYYNILGVEENATILQISEAYKKLAFKFHPDKNDNDEFFANYFKSINEAKKVLLDADSKAEYDYQLLNYSEAFEVLKAQKAEEEFYRFQRKEKFKRNNHRKQRITFSVGFIALLAMISLYFIDAAEPTINDHPLEQNNESPAPLVDNNKETEVPTYKVPKEKVTSVSPTVSTNEIKVKKDITLVEEKEQPKLEEAKLDDSLRPLTQNEMETILSELTALKSSPEFNNCISLQQSINSNINKDFEIAEFLKKEGFIISGRQTISKDISGYNIESMGNCVVLRLGRL